MGERVSIGERDELIPNASWAFDEQVTLAFDDMLQRSIPQYGVMRAAVHDMAVAFLELDEVPTVVDLGCSRGETIAQLLETARALDIDARFVGVDVSQSMLEATQQRFAELSNVEIVRKDLTHEYPSVPPARTTLSVLTLQFIPTEHRQHVVGRIYAHTAKGGCLILVEKVLGQNAQLDELMVARHLDVKRRNGYSDEQIVRKRLALEGVLIPVTASANEALLRRGGFQVVDCFWRWMNFAAWVAVRTA